MPFPLPKNPKFARANDPEERAEPKSSRYSDDKGGLESGFDATRPQNPGPMAKGPPSGFPPKHQPPGSAKVLKKKTRSKTGHSIRNQFALKV